MKLSPAAAAKRAGVSRSVISRALKEGSLVGVRKNNGHWSIQEADLEAWLEKQTARLTDARPPDTHEFTESLKVRELTDQLTAKTVELAEVKARLDIIEASVADIRQERDAWKSQAETLAAATRDVSHTQARPGLLRRLFKL